MADVVIFSNANEAAARHRTTQAALQRVTFGMASVARATLAAHRHDGHARIETSKAVYNHFVTLDDEAGLGAAMTIEYGRNDDADGKGGMVGIAPLRTAMGLSGRALRKKSN